VVQPFPQWKSTTGVALIVQFAGIVNGCAASSDFIVAVVTDWPWTSGFVERTWTVFGRPTPAGMADWPAVVG